MKRYLAGGVRPLLLAATSPEEPFWAAPELQLTRVTPTGGCWTAPAVSPDGHRLAVLRRMGMGYHDEEPVYRAWILAAARNGRSNGAPAVPTFTRATVSNHVSWSRDGRALVWDTLACKACAPTLRMRFVDAGAERDLIRHTPEVAEYCPSWSPTGDEIAYYSDRIHPLGLWVARPDGEPRQLAHFADHLGANLLPDAPTWSPDGRWIAAERDTPDCNLWVYARDGGQAYRHGPPAGDTTSPTWSPDSRQLAYVENYRTVALADRDGSRRRPLWTPPENGVVVGARWAPHDETLLIFVLPARAFEQERGAALHEIWQLHSDTDHAALLLRTPGNWHDASWCPDGSGFYFVRQERHESHIWRACFPSE